MPLPNKAKSGRDTMSLLDKDTKYLWKFKLCNYLLSLPGYVYVPLAYVYTVYRHTFAERSKTSPKRWTSIGLWFYKMYK